MGSEANRLRKRWQDYGGLRATTAEHTFHAVFEKVFKNTEYRIVPQPTCFKNLYVNIPLSEQEIEEIYNPPEIITKHGIQPDCLIQNTRTNKTIFIELKRQDGWVEGKTRAAGRGNAHERLCKYFTPGLLKTFRTAGNINNEYYPFWIVFQGDITRDPCRVREITFWFDNYKANYFFWRNTQDPLSLIDHFEKYIVPILE